MTGRRRAIALSLGAVVVLLATPALASLTITNRMQADTVLVEGPRFYGYRTGTVQSIALAEASLDGLALNAEGAIELGRGGLAEPGPTPWWDAAWTARSCGTVGSPPAPTTPPETTPPETAPPTTTVPAESTTTAAPETTTTAAPAESTTTAAPETTTTAAPAESTTTAAPETTTTVPEESTTTTAEPAPAPTALWSIELDSTVARVANGWADLRVIDNSTGNVLGHNITGTVPSAATEVLFEADPDGADVCVYWGNPSAPSVENEGLLPPMVTDGTWRWERWSSADDGLSLDLVDWTAPDSVESVTAAEAPADECERCATELRGFVVAPSTGSYVFHLAADEVGRLELAADDDPARLAVVVETSEAIAGGDFSAAEGASVAIELTEGASYAIRARSKDLTGADHLQIAWSIDGAAPELVPSTALADSERVPGQLTLSRHLVVPTADFSPTADEMFEITTPETSPDSCDLCRHRIGGYVLVEEAGTHRFWLSSDDEGTLLLSTTGDPADAVLAAWTPTFTPPSTWDTFAAQRSIEVDLAAGQTIWLEATNRDAGGPDHLQVGWSLTSPDSVDGVVELIPTRLLSRDRPAPALLEATRFATAEGLRESSGRLISPVIDTTADGSGVHGLVEIAGSVPAGTTAIARLAFADDPDGPWTELGPERDPAGGFLAGDPVPLAADGRRYARFELALTTTDPTITPMVAELSLEHDLQPLAAAAATSPVSAAGVGDHHLVRVKGSAGPLTSTTLEILPGGSLVGFSGAAWIGPGTVEQVVVADGAVTQGTGVSTGIDPSLGQHLGVRVDTASGPAQLRIRWVATGVGGALLTHDLVIAVSS